MSDPTMISNAVAAVVAALKSAPAVCPEISRGRRRVIALEVDASVVVRPVQSEAMEFDMSGAPANWRTKLAIECYARSGASVDPDAAVDALMADTYARLREDPSLGGVIASIAPEGIGFDFDVDGQQTTCATLVFTVTHLSPIGDTLN